MKENRKAVRVETQGICTIINNEKNTSGFLKDVSISGIGFFSYDNYELNENIKLRITLDKKSIELKGVVVFKLMKEEKMTRYGLEIEDISNEDYEKLNNYVTKEIKNMWSNKMKKYSVNK